MRLSKNQMDRDVFIQARRDAEYILRQAKRNGWQCFCSGITIKQIREIFGILLERFKEFQSKLTLHLK